MATPQCHGEATSHFMGMDDDDTGGCAQDGQGEMG